MATKYTNAAAGTDPNTAGNQRKNMVQAVERASSGCGPIASSRLSRVCPMGGPQPGAGRAGVASQQSRKLRPDAVGGPIKNLTTQAGSNSDSRTTFIQGVRAFVSLRRHAGSNRAVVPGAGTSAWQIATTTTGELARRGHAKSKRSDLRDDWHPASLNLSPEKQKRRQGLWSGLATRMH
jgi:hypothetical protein